MKCSRFAFLLIAPSRSIEDQVSKAMELSTSDEPGISPWNIHLLFVAESMEGWMDYMAWIEADIKEQVSSNPGEDKKYIS
jgi:hypothetical protein